MLLKKKRKIVLVQSYNMWDTYRDTYIIRLLTIHTLILQAFSKTFYLWLLIYNNMVKTMFTQKKQF